MLILIGLLNNLISTYNPAMLFFLLIINRRLQKEVFFITVYKSLSPTTTESGGAYPSGLTLREFVEKRKEINRSFYSRVETKMSETTLNGIVAIKEEDKKIIGKNFSEASSEYSTESELTIYYINRETDNRKFSIGYDYFIEGKEKYQSILEQILSTFKFMEQ